jgi:hypothetical protein
MNPFSILPLKIRDPINSAGMTSIDHIPDRFPPIDPDRFPPIDPDRFRDYVR